jgi:pilus assembly protein CpaC
MANQSLPTDFYIEPNDMEFFLEGLMEGRGKNRLSSLQNGLDGEFGHVMP